MTKENARELRMDLAKDALALLTFRGEMDVRFHGNVSGSLVRLGTSPQRSSGSRWPCSRKSRRRSEPGRAMHCRRRNCP